MEQEYFPKNKQRSNGSQEDIHILAHKPFPSSVSLSLPLSLALFHKHTRYVLCMFESNYILEAVSKINKITLVITGPRVWFLNNH